MFHVFQACFLIFRHVSCFSGVFLVFSACFLFFRRVSCFSGVFHVFFPRFLTNLKRTSKNLNFLVCIFPTFSWNLVIVFFLFSFVFKEEPRPHERKSRIDLCNTYIFRHVCSCWSWLFYLFLFRLCLKKNQERTSKSLAIDLFHKHFLT